MTEKYKPGMRVGVFPTDHLDENHAYHCGYGTYEGSFSPPIDLRYYEDHMDGPSEPNPRIKLDSGDIVWGYECWWMPANEFDAALDDARAAGREVTLVQFTRKADIDLN